MFGTSRAIVFSAIQRARNYPYTLHMGEPSPNPAAPANTAYGDWTAIPEQLEIIEAPPDARLLVVAPPGTGKTAVACARVSHLIRDKGVSPSNILIVSFTRTAVAEIRARIERHVGPGVGVSSIPITTIDSQAWALQQGFAEDGGASNGWLGTDYDVSIERALDLLKKRSADVIDFLERFEHVVVDEAQDLVGMRLSLVAELVACLPGTCGVTVFADFLQAIYDFANQQATSDTVTSSALRDMLGKDFVEKKLTHLHRFKSEKLAAVLTQVRSLLESTSLPPGQLRSCVKELLEREKIVKPMVVKPWEVPQIPGIRELDSLLVLFRSRAEVLCASSSLAKEGISHRVRMSGLPDCMHAWIGRVFLGFAPSGLVLGRQEFTERGISRGLDESECEKAWDVVRRLARRQDGIDCRRLRQQLSRPRPPVEACFLDLGTKGPTVGTVHASKGREARKVLYCIPPEGKDTFEEARIDYVAFTRGSETVHVGGAAPYGASEQSGRAYRFEARDQQKPDVRTAHIEVGRRSDLLDQHVLDGEGWQQVQEHLWTDRIHVRRLTAQAAAGTDWEYDLFEVVEEPTGVHHGRLSKGVRYDAFEIGKELPARQGKRWIPGTKLYQMYRVAVRTIALGEDDPRLGELPAPVRESGYFLSPVVRGWSLAYFNSK